MPNTQAESESPRLDVRQELRNALETHLQNNGWNEPIQVSSSSELKKRAASIKEGLAILDAVLEFYVAVAIETPELTDLCKSAFNSRFGEILPKNTESLRTWAGHDWNHPLQENEIAEAGEQIAAHMLVNRLLTHAAYTADSGPYSPTSTGFEIFSQTGGENSAVGAYNNQGKGVVVLYGKRQKTEHFARKSYYIGPNPQAVKDRYMNGELTLPGGRMGVTESTAVDSFPPALNSPRRG